MAVLKCKMCGGELVLDADSTVAECEYCGSKQTVPKIDDEKKMTLFARANRLLFACEFDKASGIYETIVSDFPQEAEAYWGLCLCKYGIEYVDDPATAKKIPTCHRSSFDSIMDDSDFELVMENSDPVSRAVYRQEAKQIEELRKSIIEASNKEEPYDIFICYKETAFDGDRTIDSVIAQDVYNELTKNGYRVFFSRITLEDKLGQEYEPYIFAALNSAKIMLAFGTDYEYYNAVWVKNEWSRYLHLIAKGENKTLIPCYKNIDAYDMPKEFAKLQSQDMGKVGAIQDLLRGIEKILPKNNTQENVAQTQSVSNNNQSLTPLMERAFMFLEDKDFVAADEYCEKVLDQDPKFASAYLGKAMAMFKIQTIDEFLNVDADLRMNRNLKRAYDFGDESLKAKIDNLFNKKDEIEKELQEQKAREFEERKEQLRIKMNRQKFSSKVCVNAACTVAVDVNGKAMASTSTFEVPFDFEKVGYIKSISVGSYHYAMLKANGIVKCNGVNLYGQCATQKFSDIVAVSTRDCHTLLLRRDGRAFCVGYGSQDFDESKWTDIVSISAGYNHSVGVKSDGTVVADGNNDHGQCDVEKWKDIVSVSAGRDFTLGLRCDGTVVAVGKNDFGQCDVHEMNEMISVSAGVNHTVGVKFDGTVVAIGNNDAGQCDVKDFADVVCSYAGSRHTVCLKSDGTLLVCGDNSDGRCNVQGWRLFQNVDTYDELENIGIKNFVGELEREKHDLQIELSQLKGIFSGIRKTAIMERIKEIENELICYNRG